KCRIQTGRSGLATIGEKVVVFDYGPLHEEKSEASTYGDKVRTFGPGGSNCPVPVAKFKANGTEGDIKIKAGETVSFDSSPSVLTSGPAKTAGFRREVIWKFGDGTEETIKGVGVSEAVPTTTHKYTSGGTFKATVQIRLKKPTYGNPEPVSHSVEAEGGGPTQFLLKGPKNGTGSGPAPSSPAGINCGSGAGCESLFNSGTEVKLTGTPAGGSKAVVWSGCDEVVGSN